MAARILILLALAQSLAGCATKGPYGNFAAARPVDDRRMAEDTAKQLATLFPPAKTHLKLSQPADDAYGSALVEQLRKAGYAVSVGPEKTLLSRLTEREGGPSEPGTDLHYVVDRFGEGSYRVSVQVGGQTLSRMYLSTNQRLAAAAYWARKE